MTTQADLDDRYGRRSPRRARAVLIIVAALAAIAVAVFAWRTLANPASGVDGEAAGYTVSPRAVTIKVQLTAPAGVAIACALSALDEQFGVVGWKVVELAASGTHVRTFTQTVPTVAEATTGLVNSCWVA